MRGKIILLTLGLLAFGCESSSNKFVEEVMVDGEEVLVPTKDYVCEDCGVAADIIEGYQEFDTLGAYYDFAIGKSFKYELEDPEEEEDSVVYYDVEIDLVSWENEKGIGSLSDYVRSEYPGYSIEFVDFGDFSGVYVDEGKLDDSVRHLYFMSKGGAFINSASYRVLNKRYNEHIDEFEDFIETIEIF